MKSAFFDTPDAAIAINFKTGSSSIARAVIAAFHPELNTKITSPWNQGGVAYPEGVTADTARWQALCPKVTPTDRPVTLVLVREPVEHFRSACAESNVTDVDAQLTALEAGWGGDAHFWPQSRLTQGNVVKVFRFPDDLDAFAAAAGLVTPLPNIGPGRARPKPTLTDAQTARVLAIYAADVTLFNSITAAGQEVTPTVDEEEIAAALADAKQKARDETKSKRDDLLAAGFTYDGKLIQTRDEKDISNINSAALRAVNDSTFSTVWICADNSYLPLDHAGILAMQSAMVSRGNDVFAAFTALATQIEACATVEQVNALPALTV